MIYIHQWVLFTHEEEQNYVISRKTNEDENHYIGQNKLDLDERQMSHRITFISLEQSNQQKPEQRVSGAQGIRTTAYHDMPEGHSACRREHIAIPVHRVADRK